MVTRVTASGVNVRTLLEFGLALRSGPFRVALVLSLIVHLVLFVVIGWGRLGREGGSERRIPLMRVRLLLPAIPVEVPAAPAITPAVKQPRRERAGRQAAADPPPIPAPALRSPETTESTAASASTVAQAPGPALAPEMTVRGEVRGRQSPEETSQSSVTAALSLLLPPRAEQVSFAPAAGGQATGPSSPVPVPATAVSGSGGGTATGTEREGHKAIGAAVAAAGDAGTGAAAAAATSRQGPGPRDLAAVRHRIDSHKVYPQIAVRNGWEGRVLVEMRLEGDGSLTAVRLLEGSGYAVLDDATIVAVRRASPFPPIARVLTVPVEYRLVP
jgi:protein TonB